MTTPTKNDRPVLNYAKPEVKSGLTRFLDLLLRLAARVIIAVVLFFAAILLPHPEGIWYFGSQPQWLVAIDYAGLEIGPSSRPVLLGMVPVIAAKLLVVALPAWLIWRFGFGRAKREVHRRS